MNTLAWLPAAAALAPACAAQAQEQLFSNIAAGESGSGTIVSVDVSRAGRTALRCPITTYTGDGGPLTRLRRGAPLVDLPGIGQARADISKAWALADGRITGIPLEVLILGLDDGANYTPLLWGRGPAPDLPGFTLDWTPVPMTPFVSQDDGTMTTLVRLAIPGSPTNTIVVRVSPSGSRTLYRYGFDPLHRPNTYFAASADVPRIASNAAGACVFTGGMFNPTIRGTGVLYADDQGARVIVDPTTPLPAPAAGGSAQNVFSPPCINDAGEVAFIASVTGYGTTLFRWTPFDGLSVALGASFPVAAFGPGITARINESSVLALSGSSDILFGVRLTGAGVTATNDTALLIWRSGELIPVCREGDAVWDRPGKLFGEHTAFSSYAYLNARGQVLFRCATAGQGGAGVGVFAWSRGAGMRTIAMHDEQVEFDGGLETVNRFPAPNFFQLGNHWLHASGGQDGRLSMLSEDGVAVIPIAFRSTGERWGLYRCELAPPCPPDFNGDDFLDFFDVIGFVEAFERGDPEADYNHDGSPDFMDYVDFMTAWEAGC
jgi:hypothetical protein